MKSTVCPPDLLQASYCYLGVRPIIKVIRDDRIGFLASSEDISAKMGNNIM